MLRRQQAAGMKDTASAMNTERCESPVAIQTSLSVTPGSTANVEVRATSPHHAQRPTESSSPTTCKNSRMGPEYAFRLDMRCVLVKIALTMWQKQWL
jgi:hypothetical protein